MKITKKFTALLLSFVLTASVLTVGSIVTARKYGDLNSDGKVNLSDLIDMRKYLAKWSVKVDTEAADVNKDEKINLLDLIMMRKVLVHLLPDFEDIPEEADYGEVPAEYPTETINDVAINQIGYVPDAEKVARITVPERKQTYMCYVVNKATGKVVYSGESKSSSQVDSLVPVNMSQFDFSTVKEVGEYYIATPAGRSTTITISKQPYNKLQDTLTTALYYQRCGEPLLASIVGETFAHDGCHSSYMPGTANAKAYFMTKYSDATDPEDPTYKKYMLDETKTKLANDFSGGLHDAGDYGRYTIPANGVVAALVAMSELFPEGCTTNVITDNAGDNIPDTLDEARYEMKWLLKMQEKEDGSVYFRIATKRFADYVMPQNDSLYYSGLYISRAFRKTTAGFAGNAAACYTAFKNTDPEFAKQCLDAAKLAYNYVEKNETENYTEADFGGDVSEYNGAGAGEYGSSDYSGEYYYAAAALFRATGESKYHDKFKEIYAKRVTNATTKMNLYQLNGYNANGGGTISYLQNPNADKTVKASIIEQLGASAKSISDKVRKNKYGCPTDFATLYWGSNNGIANAAGCCAMYNYFTGTNTYETAVRKINDYILGCNVSTYSFVSDCGEHSVQNPHHRQSMVAHKTVPGMLVGGMNIQADRNGGKIPFEDNANLFTYNEPCIYLNTAFMFDVAYLVAIDKASK